MVKVDEKLILTLILFTVSSCVGFYACVAYNQFYRIIMSSVALILVAIALFLLISV